MGHVQPAGVTAHIYMKTAQPAALCGSAAQVQLPTRCTPLLAAASACTQYGNGDFAPGVALGDWGKWRCGHYLLLAHAYAVKQYRDKYQKQQGGKIGMALWSEWSEPWRNTAEGACSAAAWRRASGRASSSSVGSSSEQQQTRITCPLTSRRLATLWLTHACMHACARRQACRAEQAGH